MPEKGADGTGRDLVLVLGDQLSLGLSSLRAADPANAVVLMAEVYEEASYVPHHKKKLAFIFSAMRHFADALRAQGWTVEYTKLDDPGNAGSFDGEVERAIERHRPACLIVTEPGEWRVAQKFADWRDSLDIPVEVLDDDRFLCSRADFRDWAAGRKSLRMEYFYRDMRRRTGLLMDGDEPEGGRWNFDAENRKPADDDLFMPQPARFAPDDTTREVLALVDAHFSNHVGDLEPFWFAVTREDAEAAFETFVKDALPLFGDYQDAMLQDRKFLFHSVCSLYLNAGLLDPLDMCRRAEAEYYSGRAPLNAVEGYIRQILGWREYIRGIYWLKMPEYADSNFFEADNNLPGFYWTGETDLACVRAAAGQTIEEAYAHHIQRLMITGNLAMLMGVDPKQIHEWYLAVYADAYEWVEMPNTLGMSQFADGGLLGSKPYAAGGNYINKMSDYCGHCAYDVKQKTGPRACPFNYLYWDFLARNRDKLEGNPRLGPVYRTWDKMSADKREATRESARAFIRDACGQRADTLVSNT
ncbi:cryptochrome/photolyase family protein [Dichotomicrobium thermohalophilum]|uniref:Deoxyribodipyrimidine photolyase-related protein n=1 Tax=Dichotomicrobium thermohalophilum TaxID=933063 RepID=A0A397Q9Q8_9HYPH|nr:cryptochrome/photolyase family protein [Dichotomicrobium thermohalophilum]RIA56247.1 deoxyribodipyrimidine photolyase-related protein [Dichotomicrobium thermohalophilum]